MNRLEVFNYGKTWAVLDHHTMMGIGFRRQATAERVAGQGVEYLNQLDCWERRHYDTWLDERINA